MILLLISIPFHIVLKMSNTDIKIHIKYGPIKQLKLSSKEEIKEKEPKKEKEIVKKIEEKEPDSLSDMIDQVSQIGDVLFSVLKRLGNNIKLTVKRFDVMIAGFDASTTALVYGSVQMFVYNAIAVLSKFKWFVISKKCKGVSADFLKEKSDVQLELDLQMSIIKAIVVLLPASNKIQL